ncbi:hypothetical protein A6E05_18715 [Aliivibrio sp. 1S165]|uniref:DUF1254 domain-containing protein n=1 Tax=unclassified Aliivibrio TaxID=2645654 RepID=UPI00080D9F40|nr:MULTISPECIES: DUF1254 domain-containing protein [unclassified Aliivibrio]OCH15303.1 hypothetical protein A6E05_18715 [Aliivibrio sp. 1S165]OCH34308.1 hypothetical protein A6E06_00295 [Aliivibrio sp. 1S175]
MFKKQFTATIIATILMSSLSINAQEVKSTTLSPAAQIHQNQASTWLNQESYILATNAYLWGSTLVRMEQVARQYTDMSQPQNDTSYRAPLNHFGHARRLPTDQDTDMPTANRDTLYSSAIVDVSKEPVILSTPEVENRYFVIDMFDMWHNLFKYVGTRATGDSPQKIMIVPPHWQGTAPEGVQIVESPTSKVWLWGRTQVFGEKDYSQVHKIQDKYTLTPLSMYKSGKITKFSSTPLTPRAGKKDDPLRFYEELGAYLKDNPIPEREQALLGQFNKIGLSENGFDRSKLTPSMKIQLEKALEDGPQIVANQTSNPVTMKIKDGWYYSFVLDQFGDDNALRSLVSHPYLGGQGAKEAMYPITYADSQGKLLSGNIPYSMHFKAEPPVDSFWSVTVYDAKTKMLISNEIQRFNINDQTSIQKNKDGSFDLILSNKKPTDHTQQKNWLPTPKGNFYAITRLYIPSKDILDMKWTVPPINPIK